MNDSEERCNRLGCDRPHEFRAGRCVCCGAVYQPPTDRMESTR